jgi:feruloyl esterase
MAEKIIGSREATQDFYRLFMIPGRSHCHRGSGAFSSDFLSYLEDWVEKDKAPDVMVGYHPEGGSNDRDYNASMKANTSVPDRYDFSRPHYPYPLWAKYRGNGDPKDYRNFEPVDPEQQE